MGTNVPQCCEYVANQKRLEGRTIVVTRQKHQAADLAAILENAGARVVYFPTIEVVPPESWSALDNAIKQVASYDWIVLTSANGVEFFSRRVRELGLEISVLSSAITCAIGPATAAALESAGARVDVRATDSRAEGVLEAIVSQAGSGDNLKGLRFLIPRAHVARELLPAELRRLGAIVDAVDAYQTIKPDVDPKLIKSLLAQHQLDAVTFTSPSTVEHFAELVGGSDLAGLLRGVLIACIGPVTAAAAKRSGLELIVQPESQNGEALAKAIIDALGSQGGPS